MAVLIAPNGVAVNASELDTPIFLANGYTWPKEPETEQPKQARKRTRKKAVDDEPTD